MFKPRSKINEIRHYILIFILFNFLPGALHADSLVYDNFQVSSMPWLDRHQIEFDLSARSSAGITSNTYPDTNYTSRAYFNDYQNIDSDINLLPDIRYEYITEKEEHRIQLPIDLNWQTKLELIENRYLSNPGINQEISSSSIAMGTDPHFQFDFYYFSPFFIGLKTDLDTSVYWNKSKSETESNNQEESSSYHQDESEYEKYQLNLTQKILAGWGRIQKGQYAYYAMQIIEDLSQQEILKRPVVFEDMEELSSIIARASYHYVFDQRIKQMQILRSILSFLSKNNYMAQDDLEAFLVVNDTFNHLPEAQRAFGLRFNGRLGAQVTVDNNESKTINESGKLENYQRHEAISWREFIGGEIAYHVPMAREWQFDFTAWIDFTPGKRHNGNLLSTQQYLEGNLKANLAYYYNTRWKFYVGNELKSYYDIVPQWEILVPDNGRRFKEHYQQISINNNFHIGADYQLHSDIVLSFSLTGNLEYERYFNYRISETIDLETYDLSFNEIQHWKNQYPRQLHLSWYASISINYRLF